MGRPFQTPFASPSGKGLSSSRVNVVWGSSALRSFGRFHGGDAPGRERVKVEPEVDFTTASELPPGCSKVDR